MTTLPLPNQRKVTMLTKGDLVRVKQDAFLYPTSQEPWFVKRVKHPMYGIVLGKGEGPEIKVFVDEHEWFIHDKSLQLIGEKRVCKAPQTKLTS